MNPLERSSRLRLEADIVMQKIGLHQVLMGCRRVEPTGSYFLDVMVYPDIDLMISKLSTEQFFRLGGELAGRKEVTEVVFQKSRIPNLPGGLYLKPRIDYGDWGRPWKIDIWSLDDPLIDERMRVMCSFKKRMTEAIREQIITYKYSILTEEKRTPMYSGYFVCKAFIDEDLSDFEDVTRYLVENGVKIG